MICTYPARVIERLAQCDVAVQYQRLHWSVRIETAKSHVERSGTRKPVLPKFTVIKTVDTEDVRSLRGKN